MFGIFLCDFYMRGPSSIVIGSVVKWVDLQVIGSSRVRLSRGKQQSADVVFFLKGLGVGCCRVLRMIVACRFARVGYLTKKRHVGTKTTVASA